MNVKQNLRSAILSILAVSLVVGLLPSVSQAQLPTCKQGEMQFIGKISAVRTHRIDQGQFDCFVQINFEQMWQSVVCPLNLGAVDEVYMGPYHCSNQHSVGDAISGVLVDDGSGIFRID